MAAVSWPLLRKELRQSLRAKATLIVENLYLLILVALAGWEVYASAHSCSPRPTWECGRTTFWHVAQLQAILLGLVAAALGAAAVTAESEQKTQDLLLVTPARVREIVRSKFLAAFVIVLVLVLLSVPVSVLCLLLGGLTWQEVAWAYLLLLTWLALAGTMGILTGALVHRTIAAVPLAIVAAYLVTAASGAMVENKVPHAALGGTGALSLLSREIPLSFFGFHLPVWAASLALCIPLGACLMESAVDRVRLAHQRRPIAQRIWMLLFAAAASALALGTVIAQPPSPQGPPWDPMLGGLTVQGVILLLLAAIFSSQGLGKRDHAALRGERQPFLHALFGAGPRAGARFIAVTAVTLLAGWAVAWPLMGRDVGVPGWRIALAVANLLAGAWVACLLGQWAAFWGKLRREWIRRTVGVGMAVLLFGGIPAAAGIIWHGHALPPPVSAALLLTNPVTGCVAAFDPPNAIPGSKWADDLDRVLPLGLYPLLFSLLLGVLLALALTVARRRLRAALMEGRPPAPREAEAASRPAE